jgi:lipopolysaccharide/colanic/teichoic acid biosynthesis glycosyltransferase
MSLVGPRPERPVFVDTLDDEIPFYRLGHTIRPGIAGWAQVRYKNGSSIEDAKGKLSYVKNISAGLDVLVFFQTIKIIPWGRGPK